MVKVTGPLFSLSAHGWLGKYTYARIGLVSNPYPIALINPYLKTGQYYSVKGWCYQRKRTWHGIIWSAMKPPISIQPKTALQEAWKQVFADAILVWQSMTDATKDIYKKQRYPVHASGYNRFIRQYLHANYPPVVPSGDSLLQEIGDKILQEIGDSIILEKDLLLLETGDKLLLEIGDSIILGS